MGTPYYVPKSIAPILQEGLAARAPYLSQPMGLDAAAPVLGKFSDTAFAFAKEQKQKQTVMDAQRAYADYLSKIDSGMPLSDRDHETGRMAGMALGITPKEPPVKEDPFITDPSFLKQYGLDRPTRASQVRLAPKPVKPPQPSANSFSALPQPDRDIITQALLNGNLVASDVNKKGADLPALVASLKSDPNWKAGTGIGQRAGEVAGASAAASLNSGGNAQQSARAASTVKSLLPGLLAKSANYSRSGVRWLNTPLNAIDEQTGSDAMAFKQYMIDTRTKMATALTNGHVPQKEANEAIAKAFPDNMTAAQVPKAAQTIQDIMNTQITGALTPVKLSDANTTTIPAEKKSGNTLEDAINAL